MRKLSKATTILFEPTAYQRLEKLARASKVSVAELVRKAVEEKYLSTRDERVKAVESLAGLNAPVAMPERMEREIEKGRFELISKPLPGRERPLKSS